MKDWRKSSHSAACGDCVEAAGNWRKSSRCQNYECAEAGQDDTGVLVRDTKDKAGPMLKFPRSAWVKFTAGVKHAPA